MYGEISPADWGSVNNPDTWSKSPQWNPERYVLHWHGPAVTIQDEKAALRAVEDFHINGRKWRGIAYNYIIGQTGTIYRGRGENRAAAHHGDVDGDGVTENLEGVAVLFLFGQGQTLSKAAKQAFQNMWKIRPMEVIGHRDVKSTECPSDEVYNWIKAEGYKDPNKLPDTNEQPYQMLVCPSCSYKLKIC